MSSKITYQCDRCGSVIEEQTRLNMTIWRTQTNQKEMVLDLCFGCKKDFVKFMEDMGNTTFSERIYLKL